MNTRHWQTWLICALLAWIAGCEPELSQLDRVRQSGEIIIATRVSPTTYYTELDQPSGFEYELAQRFADYLGVRLRMIPYSDLPTLLAAVQRGDAQLAAAGLTITDERSHTFLFTAPYQQIHQQVIYKLGNGRPERVDDLVGRTLVTLAKSSHSELLSAINQQRLRQELPTLTWEEHSDSSPRDLLTLVENGLADYALVDSNLFSLHRDIFPELRVAFDIAEGEPLAWALARSGDDSLFFAAEYFFKRMQEDGSLEALQERFYGHRQFDYVGARTFMRHMESRLPKYEKWFRESANNHDLDWRLMAAIGYQESLWNPNAISPTGVRGIMMLTRRTAKEVGVSNRNNAEQSIRGGAYYFRKMYDRLPDSIVEPHRSWFALAAYNAGYGHIMDARRLTEQKGADPNDWFAVREHLPLLRQPEYYRHARYGYARGALQALHYVRNVRKYYEAMVWATDSPHIQQPHTPVDSLVMRQELVH